MNPTEEELVSLKLNMESRRASVKGKNKTLKREASADEPKSVKGKKLKVENGTSSIAQKLIKLEDPDMAKLKSSYSIAKDPNAR